MNIVLVTQVLKRHYLNNLCTLLCIITFVFILCETERECIATGSTGSTIIISIYPDTNKQTKSPDDNIFLFYFNRKFTKSVFNKQFGSVFRTFHNPTYFTRRMNRFADVYMSSVTNLSSYPLDYTFYPRRVALPHQNAFSVVDSSAP